MAAFPVTGLRSVDLDVPDLATAADAVLTDAQSAGTARWLVSSAGGNGASVWDQAGGETPVFSFPLQSDAAADRKALDELDGIYRLLNTISP